MIYGLLVVLLGSAASVLFHRMVGAEDRDYVRTKYFEVSRAHQPIAYWAWHIGRTLPWIAIVWVVLGLRHLFF